MKFFTLFRAKVAMQVDLRFLSALVDAISVARFVTHNTGRG